MSCKFTEGLTCPTCDDLKSLAGIYKEIYIGNKIDLDFDVPYDLNPNGTVLDFNPVNPTPFLYKFCFKKNSGSGLQEMQIAESGRKFWNQTITGKLEQQSQEAKNTLDDLKNVDNLFVLLLRLDNKFELYGFKNGVEVTALTKSTGALAGDDNTYSITLSNPNGGEQILAPEFFDTNYATTYAKVEGYLVP